MIFHSRQGQIPTDRNGVMISESIGERVTTMKLLEVHLDDKLTRKTHLTSISKKKIICLYRY